MQRITHLSIGLALSIALMLLPGQWMPAATVTWNGGGTDSLWTTAANWGGTAPSSNDTLVFDGSTRLANTNDFSSFSTPYIKFNSTAGAFTLSGSSITMASGTIENLATTTTETLALNIDTTTRILFRTAFAGTTGGDIVVTGTISGSGGIEKQVVSSNTAGLVLSGLNTYTGQTVLGNGLMKFDTVKNVGEGPSSLGAPTTVANGTIVLGNNANSVTLMYTGTGSTTDRNVTISGTGNTTRHTLSQNGTGNLKFTGTFTSSQATTTSPRILGLDGSTSGTGEISGPIQDGIYTPTSDVVATQVRKMGTGTWVLSGANTFSGTTQISGGTLSLQNAGALGGGGNITFIGGTLQYSASNTVDYSSRIVSSGSAIRIDTNGQTVTFANAIASSNSGGLIKSGAGKLLLNGANQYTGDTIIQSGTLGGSGSVLGNVTINSGATLSPGNSPGKMDVGSLTLDNGSATLMEVNGTVAGTDYDQVHATGAVSFGGTLSINIGYNAVAFGTDPGQSFMNGDKWSLFTSDGSTFSGDFSSIALTGSYGNVSFTEVTPGYWAASVAPNLGFSFYTSGVNAGVLFAVPEPGAVTLASLGASLAGAAGFWRRRARRPKSTLVSR